MNGERDDDAALRRVLRDADPASALPPLSAHEADRVRERVMLTPQHRAPAPRRRGWLVGGFSVATTAVAGVIAIPLVIGTGAAGVTALQAPPADGPAAICAEVSTQALETADLAFRAEVGRIDGETVTLTVIDRFTGDVSETVTIPQGDEDGIDGGAPSFVEGDRYLIAAREGYVLGCGLTGADDVTLANIYEQAF